MRPERALGRTIAARAKKAPPARLLRLAPSSRGPSIDRQFLVRALLYWFFGGLGIGVAVMIMAHAAWAETAKLPGAGGTLESVNLIRLTGDRAGEYVDARDAARILRGSYRYDAASRVATIEAQGRKASLLVGGERIVIARPGASQIAGRLPKPPIRDRGRTLLTRAAALSFLRQFNTASSKPLAAAVAERVPLPLKPREVAPAVPSTGPTAVPIPSPPAASTEPQASGPDSGARRVASFIRSIVIDPGHGDHDAGAIGPGGTKEKDINLDVGTKLAQMLSERVAGRVTMTRRDDTFLSLRERVELAKRVKADLYISVHTNSAGGPNRRAATGTEVYFFSTPSDEDARHAERLEGGPFDPKAEGIDPVLWDLMLSGNVVESHKLAEAVSRRLPGAIGLVNRGVRSARFYVMYYGVMSNIPSILVELGYVSNPSEEAKLADPEWRSKAAGVIANAVVEYLKDLEKRYPEGRGWVR